MYCLCTSIFLIRNNEAILRSICIHLCISWIQEIINRQVWSICEETTNICWGIIFIISISIYLFNLHWLILVCSEVECLDTLIVEIWAEYESLQVCCQTDGNLTIFCILNTEQCQNILLPSCSNDVLLGRCICNLS